MPTPSRIPSPSPLPAPAPAPPITLEVPLPPPLPGHYYLYLLRCADGTLYTGQTCNLSERLRKHHYRLGSLHTASHRPVALIYVEGPYPSRTAVVRRERQIKGWSHAKKEALARGDLGKLQALANNRQAAAIRREPKGQSPAFAYTLS